MADICELRYVNGNFNALDVDDMGSHLQRECVYSE